MAEPGSDSDDATLARLRFGLHELEHGVGRNIPEPLRGMLGALVGWRVTVLEQDAEQAAIEDTIIDVQVRHVPPEEQP